MDRFVIEATINDSGYHYTKWCTGTKWSEERPDAKEFPDYDAAALRMSLMKLPAHCFICEIVNEPSDD